MPLRQKMPLRQQMPLKEADQLQAVDLSACQWALGQFEATLRVLLPFPDVDITFTLLVDWWYPNDPPRR